MSCSGSLGEVQTIRFLPLTGDICAFLGLEGRVNEPAVPPLSQESTAAMEIPQARTETETEKDRGRV